MSNLDDERVFLEARLKLPEVVPVLLFVLEGPGELDQNRAQPLCAHDWRDPRLEIALVSRRWIPLVSERVEQLRREAEIGIPAHTVDPLPRCSWLRRAIV